jgi:flagellar motor switch protein FliN/FliY
MTAETDNSLEVGLAGPAETMIRGAAKNLGQLLAKPVEFSLDGIEAGGSVPPAADEGGVVLWVEFAGALQGDSWVSLSRDDAEGIVKLMTASMGMTVEDGDVLGELGMSALSEAMNQMMAGAATALSEELSDRIDISPPQIATGDDPHPTSNEDAVVATYHGEIAGEGNSTVHWQIACDLAADLVERWKAAKTAAAPEPTPQPAAAPAASPPVAAATAPVQTGVIDSVELDVAIELGSVSLSIGQLLRLKEGSVVALAQSVGDDVVMLVNGTPIAGGDVVIVDGALGFRVSALITEAKGA